MGKKTYKITALFTVITILLGGCGPFTGLTVSDVNSENGIESMTNDSLVSVGFSQLGSESTWRSANTESVKAALSLRLDGAALGHCVCSWE